MSLPPDEGSSGAVVIDTNVWISALVFGGAPRAVFETVVRRGLVIVVSAAIEDEIRRTLTAKFPSFVVDFEALRLALGEGLVSVALGSITIDVCRDPDDNRVLETAVLGAAEGLVSGDKDLLTLGSVESIAILTPAEWLERHRS
ncbi:MAG: putative toxin-antitoxin system toxin component, PIN family [Tessaracoccus sp.]